MWLPATPELGKILMTLQQLAPWRLPKGVAAGRTDVLLDTAFFSSGCSGRSQPRSALGARHLLVRGGQRATDDALRSQCPGFRRTIPSFWRAFSRGTLRGDAFRVRRSSLGIARENPVRAICGGTSGNRTAFSGGSLRTVPRTLRTVSVWRRSFRHHVESRCRRQPIHRVKA